MADPWSDAAVEWAYREPEDDWDDGLGSEYRVEDDALEV